MATVRGRTLRDPIILSYHREFADDAEISSWGMKTIPLFGARQPPSWSFVFPDDRDPVRLLAIHRATVTRYASGQAPVDHLRGGVVAHLERNMDRLRDWQIAIGYHTLDPSGTILRSTWKGAILMTCKMFWPGKPIRLALRRREARRLLEKLGVGADPGRTR